MLAPWYVYRPRQVISRFFASQSPGYQPLHTAWGGTIIADPSKGIGRSILTTGVYDLAVSEAILRLLDPGSSAIDAGANVGYMTMLMLRAGAKVTSYEPHQELFKFLQRNAPQSDCRQLALGSAPGRATLLPPEDGNDGTARIGDGSGLEVEVSTLGEASADLLKIDVEGYELEVLRGSSLNFRHIIFEDHDAERSPVVSHLQSSGLSIYSLGWSLRGPKIAPGIASLATSYEAPSYIATREPDDLERRLHQRGWRCLTSHRDPPGTSAPAS